MTQVPELPYDGSDHEPDYDPRIAEFLSEKYPDVEISDTSRKIMAAQLASLKAKYGNRELATYRYYHNDEHSIESMGRAYWFLSVASKIPGINIKDLDYELTGLAMMFHDDVLEPEEGMSPELQSARRLIEVMQANGYEETLITRAANAVIATEVRFDHGEVFQIHVKDATTDPVVVAVAFADIAATVMEGGQRMLRDVMNLAQEQSGNVISGDVLIGLLETQYDFVTKRFSDMSEYIDGLCIGNKEAAGKLKDALLTQIKTNYQEALDVAEKLKDNIADIGDSVTSELKKPVQQISEQRQKIHESILKVLRKLYWRSSPE